MLLRRKKNTLSDRSQMLGLMQRLHRDTKNDNTRLITFIAARPGEGTSTVARAYAQALAAQSKRKILFLDAGPLPARRFWQTPEASLGIVDAIAAGLPFSHAIESDGPTISTARWVCEEENFAVATHLIHDETLWKSLLDMYDTIVLAAPSLQSSYDGIMLAAQSHATLIVIEAEKTPQAVVRKLKETLLAAHVTVLGVVMNKRRFYIPDRVYRRL